VSQALLDDVRRHTSLQEQRRARVAKAKFLRGILGAEGGTRSTRSAQVAMLSLFSSVGGALRGTIE